MTLKPPTAEVLSTGTEILQGLYPDRNAMKLSRYLDRLGFRVRYHHAARDQAGELASLLAAAAVRSDLIVMTGGLGPTEDDINRHVIARLWEAPTRLDPKAERMMRERFEMRNLPMPDRNVIQAMIPRDARVFYNHNGTAPGFGFPASRDAAGQARAALVAMPGPSKEWIPMWEQDVQPWLETLFPHRPVRRLRSLHVVMIPESTINDRLRDLFNADSAMELTLLADRGHIRIRLMATADAEEQAQAILDRYTDDVLNRLPPDSVLRERGPEWSLEEELNRLLSDGRRTLAVAESCTGGLVAARITDVPGSSAYFREGFLVYSNEAKIDLLGVDPETLRAQGAVSRECALEMARGARRRSGADAAVSITGIAGPSGGSPEKPVGTVWLALDTAERGEFALHRRFPGNREAVREWACRQALDLFRRWADGLPWPE